MQTVIAKSKAQSSHCCGLALSQRLDSTCRVNLIEPFLFGQNCSPTWTELIVQQKLLMAIVCDYVVLWAWAR